HGAADDEPACGVDVVLGIGVEQVGGNGCLNHVLQNVSPERLVVHGLSVLGRNHHGVNALGLVVGTVFNCDLGFAVGAKVRKHSVFANLREALGELVSEGDWGGHEVFVLIRRVAEHHALIAGPARIYTHGDIARLLVDAGNHGAGIGIE